MMRKMKKIDLRSDTVTLPSPEMMEAIQRAKLGDDVYEEDPTVNELQELAAEKMGKEAALLVTSGTQGNLVSLLSQTHRGDEIILESRAHIYLFEVGGMAAIGGLMARPVYGERGFLKPEQVVANIRGDNIHFPRTTLLAIENTHNYAGGTVLDEEGMNALAEVAHENGLRVHLDGARIFNAAVALKTDVKRLVRKVDSIQFCLSKGLAAPIGSLVVGDRDFIKRARKYRKMLGGGMRQAGIIAAPGIIALEKMVNRLAEDHETAKLLAERLSKVEGVEVQEPETNILFINISGTGKKPKWLVQELKKKNIIIRSGLDGRIRLVTHYGITKEDILFVAEEMARLLES